MTKHSIKLIPFSLFLFSLYVCLFFAMFRQYAGALSNASVASFFLLSFLGLLAVAYIPLAGWLLSLSALASALALLPIHLYVFYPLLLFLGISTCFHWFFEISFKYKNIFWISISLIVFLPLLSQRMSWQLFIEPCFCLLFYFVFLRWYQYIFFFVKKRYKKVSLYEILQCLPQTMVAFCFQKKTR